MFYPLTWIYRKILNQFISWLGQCFIECKICFMFDWFKSKVQPLNLKPKFWRANGFCSLQTEHVLFRLLIMVNHKEDWIWFIQIYIEPYHTWLYIVAYCLGHIFSIQYKLCKNCVNKLRTIVASALIALQWETERLGVRITKLISSKLRPTKAHKVLSCPLNCCFMC